MKSLQALSKNRVNGVTSLDNVIIFLHFGVDSARHSYKPPHDGYIVTIRIIFNYDGKTTNIFAGDHGMTIKLMTDLLHA